MFKKIYFLVPVSFLLSFAVYSQVSPLVEGFNTVSSLSGSGWSFINRSTANSVSNWSQGNTSLFSAQSAPANSYIQSYGSIPLSAPISNWLITPQRTLHNGDVITFYTRSLANASEALEVRLTTDGNTSNVGPDVTSTGDFTRLLLIVNPTLTKGLYPVAWTKYTITLSNISGTPQGRIAFRHINGASPSGSDVASVGIDNFTYTVYSLASRLYVDNGFAATGNGLTWGTPFKELYEALTVANAYGNVEEIWVKKGTYKPTNDGNRDSSFRILRNGIKVYGGFNGDEMLLSGRNPLLNPTILSGDINTPNDTTDNSYHVMTIVATPSTPIDTATVIDGFNLQDGNAKSSNNPSVVVKNQLLYREHGGSIYNHGEGAGNKCSPLIRNCIFSNNRGDYGGAIFNDGGSGISSPVVINCIFTGNRSSYGGAVLNYGNLGISSPVIGNCVFTGNSSSAGGGALFNNGIGGVSSPVISNCVFINNAAFIGGACFNDARLGGSNKARITNCTFIANSSNEAGGALCNLGENGLNSPSISNCIFFNNFSHSGPDVFNDKATPLITFSLTQTYGTNGVNGNIVGANPLFINAANPLGTDGVFGTIDDGLRLQPGSPAINTGNNDSIPAGDTTDITGAARIQKGTVDMGAYEAAADITGPIVRVDSSIAISGDGSSWASAVKTLTEALDAANSNSSITEIWVSKGTYFPTSNTSRDSSFRILRNGIKVYGGFGGASPTMATRNPAQYPTILSGDIGKLNDSTDNSYHVITVFGSAAQNIDTSTRLDGFEISGGNANNSGIFFLNGTSLFRNSGGGLLNYGQGNNNNCSPTIANCTFSSNSATNYGGAIYNNGFSGGGISSPAIIRCTFSSNSASDGGAIYNNGSGGTSSPSITNCTFHSNSARGYQGGAIANYGYYLGTSSPFITNCTFHSNSATIGGAISNFGLMGTSSPSITNCTFHSNSASGDGGAIHNDGLNGTSSPAIANSVFYSNAAFSGNDIYNGSGVNATVSYSITQSAIPGQNNQEGVNPRFVNAADPAGPDYIFGTDDDGLRLQAGSPAINAGNNDSIPVGITTDITGIAARIQGDTVDMGAYESTRDVLPVTFTEVKASRKNTGIQVEWQVETEINIHRYEVEKSADGRQFTKAAIVTANPGNTLQKNYGWFDAAPFSGNNFYRIKAVEYDGGIKYTGIVRVNTGDGKSEITIYPNPVTGNSLTLQFSNQPKGRYAVQLFNGLGQQVYNRVIEHSGGSATQTFQLNPHIAKGIYTLSIGNGEIKSVQQVIVD